MSDRERPDLIAYSVWQHVARYRSQGHPLSASAWRLKSVQQTDLAAQVGRDPLEQSFFSEQGAAANSNTVTCLKPPGDPLGRAPPEIRREGIADFCAPRGYNSITHGRVTLVNSGYPPGACR